MTETKIPTDDEILEKWLRSPIQRDVHMGDACVGTTKRALGKLILDARAAGRAEGAAEQREKDAEIAENYTHQHWAHDVAEAIRAQGAIK